MFDIASRGGSLRDRGGHKEFMVAQWDRQALRSALTDGLSLEEVRTLMFDLNIDDESVPGANKSDKVRELIIYLERRNQLDWLMVWLRRNRPDLDIAGIDIPAAPVLEWQFPVDPARIRQGKLEIAKKGLLRAATANLLRLDKVVEGSLATGTHVYDVHFVVKNASRQNIVVAADEKYFALEDHWGHKAEIVYFAAPHKGEILEPADEREIRAVFEAPREWLDKDEAPDEILLRVRGFLPIMSVTWTIKMLALA